MGGEREARWGLLVGSTDVDSGEEGCRGSSVALGGEAFGGVWKHLPQQAETNV